MREHTRRRQLSESPRIWMTSPHGPFDPVRIQAPTAAELLHADSAAYGAPRAVGVHEPNHSGPVNDRLLSMTAFFEYLHDHAATTDLAKALAEVAMLRTTGARPARAASDHVRRAS